MEKKIYLNLIKRGPWFVKLFRGNSVTLLYERYYGILGSKNLISSCILHYILKINLLTLKTKLLPLLSQIAFAFAVELCFQSNVPTKMFYYATQTNCCFCNQIIWIAAHHQTMNNQKILKTFYIHLRSGIQFHSIAL